jgi:circadian clock protein KaiB
MARRDDKDGIARQSAEAAKMLRAGEGAATRYVLRLYVTGMTLRSMQAIANLKAICESRLRGQYELEVVDIYQHPRLARDEQIVAAPTLIRKLPLPLRRVVGDLSDEESVLLGLDLRRKKPA